MSKVEKIIAQTFLQMAQGLEGGSYGAKPKIILTGMGGEHGEENSLEAARQAALRGIDVRYIGALAGEGVHTVPVENEAEGHARMEKMLEEGEADGAVTMHYPFPIGVSTVGRVVTPAKGKQMFIANTTGTTSAERVEAMVRNALCGIIAAKACGIAEPRVGILNVDGARQAQMALEQLRSNGYAFEWACSARGEGGSIMRGNDVLQGTPDVLVTDSLTGNVLVKMLSAYTTGGSFESTGFGYGPGLGKAFKKLILIISRASGAPLIANAIEFAAELVRGDVLRIMQDEFEKAGRAGLEEILAARKTTKPAEAGAVQAPPSEPCTASIAGIDVMDLEDAVKVLWGNGIYAESGMGCTGPLVMMNEAHYERALALLREAGYVS